MTHTHWKKLENPDYIGAYAFQPGEEKVVTIQFLRREMITGTDGKKEECTVVHFIENEKPLILNATNGKMITKVTGTPYIEQWANHRIVLGVEKVKAFGEVVDAVRVKKKAPSQASAPIIPACVDCGQKIEGYGRTSAQSVAAQTEKRFGVALCFACAQKRTGKAKGPEEEPAEAEPTKEEGEESE